MKEFQLVLRNERTKLYDRFALLLVIVNGIAICFFLNRSNFEAVQKNPLLLIPLVVALLILLLHLFNKTTRKKGYALFAAAACLAFYWFLIRDAWIGLTLVCMFLLYAITKRELRVIFRSDEIKYPAFPSRSFHWEELSNAVLKDGLLTIDCKNNRIIQQYVDESKTTVNEKEFNEFCKQQINVESGQNADPRLPTPGS